MRSRRSIYLAHVEAVQQRSRQSVEQSIALRRTISRNSATMDGETSVGQQAADAVARFGGSWRFIMLFVLVLVAWITLNAFLLLKAGSKPFDPYPFILLNLMLSMVAALQAPVILMSQNRQGEKDRAAAQHDYEVNLKAELDIIALHEKMDGFKLQLVEMQKEQLRLLNALRVERAMAIEPAAAIP